MLRVRLPIVSLAFCACVPAALFVGCGLSSTGIVSDDGGDGPATNDAGNDSSPSDPGDGSREDVHVADAGKEASDAKDDAIATEAATTDGGPDSTPVDSGGDGPVADAPGTTSDAGSMCGNGILEPGEQCDDGNLFDLDGCDSSCKYEAVARFTSFQISTSEAPAFCTPRTNRFGRQMLTAAAVTQLNDQLKTDVTNGTENTLLQLIGLSDPTGANASGFEVGLLNASLDPAKGPWPAAGNPIDWWFLADPLTVAAGLPTGLLTNAVLANHALTAGPSEIHLTFTLFSGNPIDLLSAQLSATIAASPAPDVPAPPPAQLAAGLTVFQEMTGSGAGEGMCGNITVASLALAPILKSLTAGGAEACTMPAYAYCGNGKPVGANCNSMLDVFVGGCNVVDGSVVAVHATQPDVPGGATVQALTVGAKNKVTLPAGDTDAYSSYWIFNANRAHLTGESCSNVADCQAGKTCSAAGTCE